MEYLHLCIGKNSAAMSKTSWFSRPAPKPNWHGRSHSKCQDRTEYPNNLHWAVRGKGWYPPPHKYAKDRAYFDSTLDKFWSHILPIKEREGCRLRPRGEWRWIGNGSQVDPRGWLDRHERLENEVIPKAHNDCLCAHPSLVQAIHNLRKISNDNPNGVAVNILRRIKDEGDGQLAGNEPLTFWSGRMMIFSNWMAKLRSGISGSK